MTDEELNKFEELLGHLEFMVNQQSELQQASSGMKKIVDEASEWLEEKRLEL